MLSVVVVVVVVVVKEEYEDVGATSSRKQLDGKNWVGACLILLDSTTLFYVVVVVIPTFLAAIPMDSFAEMLSVCLELGIYGSQKPSN